MKLRRRRFLSIAAGTGLSALAPGRAFAAASAARLHRWRGVALGASASITIAHEDAPQLIARARAEIARLENIFSLHDPASALARLNTQGRLTAPPPELVELLSTCASLHMATDGAFDPTIQPLWVLYAQRHAAGQPPTKDEIDATLRRVGWRYVLFSPNEIVLTRNAMALTLNGVAQGYISDKIADLLRRAGVADVLVNMGEIVAMGRNPNGNPWRVAIADPNDPDRSREFAHLSDQAIATSAPLGTVLDPQGTVGHILDPRTGHPAARWRQVSVTAPRAARADGLSTAFCLMNEDAIRAASSGVGVHLISFAGSAKNPTY